MQFLKLFVPLFIAVFLIVSDYKFSYLDRIKHSIATLISPIYLVVNLPSQFYIWINEQGVTKQALLIQNKQLQNELTQLKVSQLTFNALLLENQKLTKLLGASYTISNHKFTLARIDSISQSRLKKQIVINKGSSDGFKFGQIVLGANGIIGQITRVSSLYSTVLMITDPTQYIPIKNQRNGIRGVGKGISSHVNKLVVNFIESDLDIRLDDVFVSSALGSKFPAGFPVGKVIHVDQHPNNPFLHIELAPIQTTEQLEFVLIGNSN